MRATARLLALPLLALAMGGCDAGNRDNPGADNRLGAPTVTVSTPFEGQTVVVSRQGASVLAKIDLTGALGRNEGTTLRYRLRDPGAKDAGPWVAVKDPSRAVSLGDLKPSPKPRSRYVDAADRESDMYVLEVEALDAKGQPFTQTVAAGPEGASTAAVTNPGATCRRSFRVALAWE